MENKAQINWLSRPTGILLLFLITFTFQAQAQDRYIGMGTLGTLYYGDIFSINTDGSNLQQLFPFNGTTSGFTPTGNLIEHGGLLYGTTQNGINSGNGGYGYGCLFSFDPSTNTQTVLYSLNGGSDGSFSYPYGAGQLTEYPNGKLYGASSGAGSNGYGTIFSWDPAISTFTKLYDLPGSALGPLTLFNYKLYGITSSGGANGYGFLFSFDPRTNIFTEIYDFGQYAGLSGPMVGYNNKLYGLNQNAGPSHSGIIFSYDPVSGIFAPVYSFDGPHGASPYQIMVYKDKFYGTTLSGGANSNSGSRGVIFSFDLATGKYTDLHDISNSYTGYQGFVIDSSGIMNGVISSGGGYGRGAFFQYDLNSNAYTQVDLVTDGAPVSGLTFVPGQNGATTQTLSFNDIPAKTYGDPDFPGGATVSSGLPVTYTSSDLTVAWTNGDQIHIVGTGTCTITATQQGNSVYAPVSITKTLTVGKASLVIRANDTVKYQYRPLPTFTLTYTGFVYGDSAGSLLTPPTISTTANANSPQGQYPIVPSGAASNNYTITYQDGVLNIVGQAQDITFNDTLKTYGDADFATATVNTGLPLTYASSNSAVAIITPDGKIHITGAGVDTITILQAGNVDYGFTSLSSILTVLPANLSIRVKNDTSIYQRPAPAFSAVYTGLVNGDTPDSLQTVFSSSGSDAGSAPGVYLIFAVAIRSKDSVNYRIVSNEPGSLFITPAGGDQNSLDAWFSSQSSLQVNLFATQQTPENQRVVLKVFDLTGRPCVSAELSLAWGYNTFTFPVSGLAAGVYIIRVSGETIHLSKTITKLL